MSFWSTQEIIRRNRELSRINSTEPLISGFKEDKVKEASYTLTVGSEAFITSSPQTKLDEVKKLDISDGFCYIPPGQFAYLITEEKVNIPKDCLAFISMKFTIKAEGLINVSGFHVDPGYSGKLVFAVYNAGVKRILIRKGMDIFLIWFSSLESIDDRPKNNQKGYDTIPSFILENSQDAETLQNLSEKVSDLESKVNQSSLRSTLLLTLLIPFDIFVFKILYEKYNVSNINIYDVDLKYWLCALIVLSIMLFHIEAYLISRKIKNLFIKCVCFIFLKILNSAILLRFKKFYSERFNKKNP